MAASGLQNSGIRVSNFESLDERYLCVTFFIQVPVILVTIPVLNDPKQTREMCRDSRLHRDDQRNF